jgi:hypothetical protein
MPKGEPRHWPTESEHTLKRENLRHKWRTIPESLLESGCVSAIDSNGRTAWIADAHGRNGKRFVVRADERQTAFLELEPATRATATSYGA